MVDLERYLRNNVTLNYVLHTVNEISVTRLCVILEYNPEKAKSLLGYE